MSSTAAKLPTVDQAKLEEIQTRYREEANKRLQSERNSKFIHLNTAEESRLSALIEDPWVDHNALNAQKPPIMENAVYEHFVLGAGFGGLQYAVRLIEEGVARASDIRLLDAAGGFGGTWYWNRFPGLHCDLEASIYLPLLEETGYIPSKRYAPGEEIREHADRIAAKWNLTDKALFRSEAETFEWDESLQAWKISVVQNRGQSENPKHIVFSARYVYLAAGVLTRPQVPEVSGLLSFRGPIFHTARWNYAVSGGSPKNQTLTGLKGKRVAVVGTAATSIGVIPEVAKYAGKLFVVQRTPANVKPRDQRVTDPEEFKSKIATKEGWQWERQTNFHSFLTNSAGKDQNLVDDAWTRAPAYSALIGSPNFGIVDSSPESLARHVAHFHALDYPTMEATRDRVAKLVQNPETAEKLKPWYPSWCKRPTFSDTYLQTFNQSNVHLLDTNGRGLAKVTETGIVIGDKEYEVDIIIFGTGYRPPSHGLGSPAIRTGTNILGRNGLSLNDKWLGDGPATLHGYLTNGFPNLFFSGTNQATVTGNNVYMLGFIAQHIVAIIAQAKKLIGKGKEPVIEVTKEAEEAHTTEILKRAAYFVALAGCTPGYFNGYGENSKITDPKETLKRARGSVWAEGSQSFLEYLQKWRDEGSLRGLSVLAAGEQKARL